MIPTKHANSLTSDGVKSFNESQPQQNPCSTDVNHESDSKILSTNFWFSWRMAVTLSAFAATCLHAVMRAVLGMTLVCMVNVTAITSNKMVANESFNNHRPNECSFSEEDKEDYNGEFTWTSQETNAIISALSWGQIITVLPAGLYADKYSARKLLFLAILSAAILTMITPFVARLGVVAMIMLRIGIGLTGGILWPCINVLVARWCPVSERSTLYGIITSGNQISVVLLMPISAALCRQRHFLGGWPVAYYLPGVISMLWNLLWLFVVADDPVEHGRISKEELAYIMLGRKSSTSYDKEKRKRLRLPFRKILFSASTLAIVCCMTSASWGILLLMNYLPTYFRDVLYLDLTSNGAYAGLPFLSQFVFKIFFSRIADCLKKHTTFNHDFIVKAFNSFGMLSLAGLLFGSTFVNCTQAGLAVALICIGAGFYSSVTPGFLASSVLIAPKYAGLVAAWINFFASLGGILLPFLVTAIVTNSQSANQWRIVVGIGGVSQILSAVVFIIWGSAFEQEWAKSFYMKFDPESGKEKKSTTEKTEDTLLPESKNVKMASKNATKL